MRTTVNIDDALLVQAKKLAQARHQSLGSILSEGLRIMIYAPGSAESAKSTRLITFAGNGTCPGVDLDSNAALLDLLEAK